MSQKLQIDHALKIIANAFHPLEVAVNAQDYKEKFGFKVFDEIREAVLHVEDLGKQQVTTPGRLQNILESARRSLAQRGFILSAWSFSLAADTSNISLNPDAPKRAG